MASQEAVDRARAREAKAKKRAHHAVAFGPTRWLHTEEQIARGRRRVRRREEIESKAGSYRRRVERRAAAGTNNLHRGK